MVLLRPMGSCTGGCWSGESRCLGQGSSCLPVGPITEPDPLDGMGEKLSLGICNAMTGVLAKKVLVGIPFGLKGLGHEMVGLNPVVHAIAHHIRV